MLLTTDWHLTDATADAYRWGVFAHVAAACKAHKVNQVYMLGDLAEKKDRHPSRLVNRIVDEFGKLIAKGVEIYLLIGNHDKPLDGPPYWKFLDQLGDRMHVVTEPYASPDYGGKLIMLPHADDPVQAWANVPMSKFKAAFIHQTINGAVGENGHALKGRELSFPRGMQVYSGDVHGPQEVKCGQTTVKYVGAPHPVDFGDDYACRMLLLGADFKITHELPVHSIKKHMLNLTDVRELERLKGITKGDQARVRITLSANQADQWSTIQDRVTIWAQSCGVTVASLEATVTSVRERGATQERSQFTTDPDAVLTAFCAEEQIEGSLRDAGFGFLKEAV